MGRKPRFRHCEGPTVSRGPKQSRTGAHGRVFSTDCATPSTRAAEAYVVWARRFILFHGKRHPDAMGAAEVKAFLTYLAVSRKVAASTQNQALSDLIRAKRPSREPVVLSPEEIARILQYLHGLPYLAVVLMYGSGLRLMECVELRVQDIDFDRGEILVRGGKGQKDRRTPFSARAGDLFRPTSKPCGNSTPTS